MILDLVLVSGAIIAIGIGYAKGFLASLFALVGYFGGALLALYGVIRFSSDWSSKLSVIALYLAAILVGASLGREIFSRIGKGIHKRILFGPLRFFDSLLGGLLSLIQYVLIAVLLLTVLRYVPIRVAHEWIVESKIYAQVSEINLLSFQISDLLQSVSSHLDQLTS